MRKVVIICLMLFICSCSNDENSLIKSNYINSHTYNQIYADLENASHNVSFIPSVDTEKDFYELIEVISLNCSKFTSDELANLYSLINNNYSFKYSKDRYNNDIYQNDLNKINKCLTE